VEGESAVKITELRNVKIGIDRTDDGRTPFRLTMQDPHTREVLWVGFGQDVADALIGQLTGGIQVVARIPPQ
jgi:hypothetical protein